MGKLQNDCGVILMKKYAVRVMFAKDDWLYVTEGDAFSTRPVLFNNLQDAEEHRKIWGNNEVAKVVEYDQESING